MNIIINTGSMIPIYEQIVEAIKKMIAQGALCEGDALPSVRTLASDLKISALTVKKAYDALEEAGLTATVHGKGSYVKASNSALLREERSKEIEKALQGTVDDSYIRQAMHLLMTKAKLTVEPSGSLPVAAALAGVLPVQPGQKVAFVLSGGNVDPALAAEILANG